MSEPFDREELLEELDGDVEFLEESLEMMNADVSPLLAELRDATARGDGEAVRKSAHTLKSMVGNFCAKPAFDAAARLEQIGGSGDLSMATQSVESLSTEIKRLQLSLKELLEGLS